MTLRTWKDIDSALAELENKEGLPDFDSLADEIGKAFRNVIPHQPKKVRRVWERRLADARGDHQRELITIQSKANELAMSISNNAEPASNMNINDLILESPADFGVSQDDFRQKLVHDVVSALSGKGEATSATNLVVCPICGRKNDPKDTFRCHGCGRDDICLRHQDEKTFLCAECMAKSNRQRQEHEVPEYRKPEGTAREALNRQAVNDYDRGEAIARQGGVGALESAAAYFRKAAEAGLADAQYKMGEILTKGKGVERNLPEAFKWFDKASAQGHLAATFHLGLAYLKGNGISQDDGKALALLERAARQGHPRAMCTVGFCHENGRGTRINKEEAMRWYRKAAANGDASALSFIEQVSQGTSTNNQPQEAANRNFSVFISEVPENAARRVIALLREEYGFTYQDAELLVKNGGIAKNGLTRPTAEEMAHALRNKGAKAESMTDAEGKTREDALRNSRKAEEKAQLTQKRELVVNTPPRRGIPGEVAREIARKTAARYWHNKAIAYETGAGVQQNHTEAMNCFRKAAEWGQEDAQIHLGLKYWQGIGVPKNIDEAIKWFSMAAEQGNAQAKAVLPQLKRGY